MKPTEPAKRTEDGREILHFLHIGKAAGSQIGQIAREFNAQNRAFTILRHPHHVTLSNLPVTAPYFFSVRNPVTRFVSGFYSRKRKGQPLLYKEWTANEASAFAAFDHANDLAEALFAPGDLRQQAVFAIKSISHTARGQVDWISPMGYFLTHRPPIAILRQEHFNTDLALLSAHLGEDMTRYITANPALAHRNDYSSVPELSPKAIANLERWYVQDRMFYTICSDWMEQKLTEA